ncbi:MAG: E3 binding domain-containing protein, partial [Candidatus Omnitrophica bacterium]|nr:E3 binding domain-containing protein [Candidatus Omnitrophota bacterium]
MAVSIKMPDLGTTVDQVKLVNWLVKEGDSIKRGDPLAQIETDKATSDLESVAEGVVLKLVAAPGSMVNKGETMAIIGRAGETVTPQSPDSSGAQTPSQPFGSPGVPAPPSVPVSPPSKGPAVSLIIRNLAAKLGVDLAQVQGTGLHGIITREDVQRTAAADVGRARPRASETLPSAQAAVARAVSRSHREI